jgi:hypothetical protein
MENPATVSRDGGLVVEGTYEMFHGGKPLTETIARGIEADIRYESHETPRPLAR